MENCDIEEPTPQQDPLGRDDDDEEELDITFEPEVFGDIIREEDQQECPF
jgi:hypothetical protein